MPKIHWIKRSSFLGSQYLSRSDKRYAQGLLDDMESSWDVRYAQKGKEVLIELTPRFNRSISMYCGTVWRCWFKTSQITFLRQLRELHDVTQSENVDEDLPF